MKWSHCPGLMVIVSVPGWNGFLGIGISFSLGCVIFGDVVFMVWCGDVCGGLGGCGWRSRWSRSRRLGR